jgi:hypothetical protein
MSPLKKLPKNINVPRPTTKDKNDPKIFSIRQ